ncbi:hypothetical protein BDW74DRAFT_65951 [Aspergillus multicolor]|uniref:uncharacterized protein n=1 Tax=Aspergillus multicolor TaxID=41759 RepID=UPI003CCD02D4
MRESMFQMPLRLQCPLLLQYSVLAVGAKTSASGTQRARDSRNGISYLPKKIAHIFFLFSSHISYLRTHNQPPNPVTLSYVHRMVGHIGERD